MKTLYTLLLCCMLIGASAQVVPALSTNKPPSALQPFSIDKKTDAHPKKKQPDFASVSQPEETAQQPEIAESGMIVTLHPSLGNSITCDEKEEFGFFPQIADSIFEMAQLVKYDDSTYTFLFHITRGGRSEVRVTTDELHEMYATVEEIKPAPPPVEMETPNRRPSRTMASKDEVDRATFLVGAIGKILMAVGSMASK